MPNRRVSLFAGLLIASGFLTAAQTAAAQDPVRFRRLVSVGVEPQVVKILETAREHIREGQWEQAIPILQELIETGSDSLIPLEPGRFGNVAWYCHLLISDMSPAGLAEYRNRIDGQAAEWLADGRANLDEAPLRRIVERAFNSSSGDEALWLLGELAFERGQYAQARQHWQLLVPPRPATADGPGTDDAPVYLTYANPDIDAANVLARLVLCSIFEGDVRRVEAELSVFQALHPDMEGRLAGESGLLVELLSSLLEEGRQWPSVRTDAFRNPTFAGRPDRSPAPVGEPVLNDVAWRNISIPATRLKGPAGRADTLSLFPVVHDRTLFVANSGSLYAFDVATGRPKWPIDDDDSGEIMTSLLNGPVMSDLPSSGVARYTMTVSDGHLYARMGLPFTRRSVHEGSSYTELVGVDLSRQGDVTFRVTPDALDNLADSPEATQWSFEGSPVVSDGRVYATARRGTPEDETAVVCFDAETSQLIWKRRVCVNVRNVPDHYNLVGHQLLTLGDGRLFLNTGTGAVAALDAGTGRILWVITWPASSNETYDQESNPQRHGLVPGLYHRGILYAVTEANELFALDATTGQPTWRRTIRDRILHLLGIVDGRLILSGNSLWALDIHTGEDIWPRLGFEDPDGFGYGRGVVTEQSVFWPLRDEILRIDHRNGEITRRIPLRQAYGLQGGNLLISGNYLVIAQADRLDALADVTQPADDAAPQPEEDVDEPDSAPASDQPASEPVESDSRTTVDVQPLWPVRRVWRQKIGPDTVVSSPSNHVRGTIASGLVLQQDGQTRLMDGQSGRSLWGVNSSERLNWTARHSGGMLLASAHQLESRGHMTGQLQWRISPESGRFRAFRLHADKTPAAEHRLLALTDSGVAAIDLKSGQRVWQWPPRDRRWTVPNSAAFGQPENWVADRSSLLIRPADSAEYSLLSLPQGRRVRHGSLPFDIDRPVSFVTVAGGTGRALIGIVDVNRIRLSRLMELGPEWTQPATAQAHGAPRVLTSGNVIVVIEDAQFAVRREPATGNILWKRSLGPLPLSDVDNESVITPDALLAVSDDTLRCFSLQTGELQWHRHVGTGRWSISPAGADYVICRPVPARVASVQLAAEASHHPRGSRIAVCDISNGKLIQRLSIDPHTHVVDVHAGVGYCCVRTTDTLQGFVPYVTTTVK